MGYNQIHKQLIEQMYRIISLTIVFLLILQGACTRSDSDFKLPGVYRVNVQQGNVIDQEMLDRLKPGMEKHQVRFIMGTPTIADPFHPDRWEYIYTLTQGASQRIQRHLTIYFVDEKLAYLDGDVKTSLRKPPENITSRSKIVDVPIREQRQKGLIERVVDKIPLIGGDDENPPDIKKVEEQAMTQPEQELEQEQKQAQEQDQEQSAEEAGEESSAEDADNDAGEKEEKGFFGRIFSRLPFVGDEEDEVDE